MMYSTVIYTRVSSKGQDDNYSPEVQKADCEIFATSQGWKVYKHLHDTQSGADFLSREYLQQAISFIRLGLVQVITFYSTDRMSRSYNTFESLTKEVYEAGGFIAVADKNKLFEDYDTFWLECNDDISGAVKERLKTKKRTGTARMKAFLEGSYMKRAPYGYVINTVVKRLDNGRKQKFNELEVVKPQAESLNLILEEYVRTRSLSAVARYANDSALYHSIESNGDIKTFWHYSTISTIVDNADLYAGITQTIKFRDTPPKKDKETGLLKITKDNPEIAYTYPEIITKELAASVRVAREQTQGRVNATARPKPFHNLVRCACGKKASYESHKDLQLSKFQCVSWAQVKQAKNIRGKEYHINPCKHSISPLYFIQAMKAYLEALDTETFISTAELALLEIFDQYTGMEGALNAINTKKAELSKMRSNLIRRSVMLDPEEDLETIRAFEDEVKTIQAELDELATKYLEEEKVKAKIEAMFERLDITYEVKESYLNSKGNFNLTKMVPRLDKAKQYLEQLKEAVTDEEWEETSRLMVHLGIYFEADFSIAGKLARRASIQVKNLLEADMFPDTPEGEKIGFTPEEVLAGGGESVEGGFSRNTTYTEKTPLYFLLALAR